SSFDALDKDLDLTAAGEADLPGLFIADPEIEQPRAPVLDRLQRLFDDRAFDTAARHRADKVAAVRHRQLGAGRARRRAPGFDHGRQGDALAGVTPRRRLFEDFHRIAHAAWAPLVRNAAGLPRPASGMLSTATNASRLSRLCTGRNSSTCGNIARMPKDFGSNPS